MQRVQILGVPIDAVTIDFAVNRIQAMLGAGKHHVATPNNEMLVSAHSDDVFRSVLNSTDLNLPDSTGLLWAARITGQHLPERVTGVDTVERLLQSLGSEHPVFFLGGRKGAWARAGARMKEKNPSLQYHGFEGSPSKEEAPEIIKRINESGAHLLFVAYGAPAQDIWINQYLMQLTSVRVAMGVGGTLDFLAGDIRRAPKWMQAAGIEWLWRLLLQPSRIGRIVTATVAFPLLVLRSKKNH